MKKLFHLVSSSSSTSSEQSSSMASSPFDFETSDVSALGEKIVESSSQLSQLCDISTTNGEETLVFIVASSPKELKGDVEKGLLPMLIQGVTQCSDTDKTVVVRVFKENKNSFHQEDFRVHSREQTTIVLEPATSTQIFSSSGDEIDFIDFSLDDDKQNSSSSISSLHSNSNSSNSTHKSKTNDADSDNDPESHFVIVECNIFSNDCEYRSRITFVAFTAEFVRKKLLTSQSSSSSEKNQQQQQQQKGNLSKLLSAFSSRCSSQIGIFSSSGHDNDTNSNVDNNNIVENKKHFELIKALQEFISSSSEKKLDLNNNNNNDNNSKSFKEFLQELQDNINNNDNDDSDICVFTFFSLCRDVVMMMSGSDSSSSSSGEQQESFEKLENFNFAEVLMKFSEERNQNENLSVGKKEKEEAEETEEKEQTKTKKTRRKETFQQRLDKIPSNLKWNPSDIKLGDKIGAGASGVVFEATLLPLQWKVAAKLFRVNEEQEEDEAHRVLDELELNLKLRHENIVAFIGIVVCEKNYFGTVDVLLLMELGNESLASFLASCWQKNKNTSSSSSSSSGGGGGEEKEILDINFVVIDYLQQIATALAFLHLQGIFHRDISSKNILCCNDRKIVKLIDFSLSKKKKEKTHFFAEEQEDSISFTETSNIAGTTRYLSPEGFGSSKIRATNDVWSFGCIAYELCSSFIHHENENNKNNSSSSSSSTNQQQQHHYLPWYNCSVSEIMTGKLFEKFIPRSDCPQFLIDLIRQCLQIDFNKRPKDGLAILEILLSNNNTSGKSTALPSSIESLVKMKHQQQSASSASASSGFGLSSSSSFSPFPSSSPSPVVIVENNNDDNEGDENTEEKIQKLFSQKEQSNSVMLMFDQDSN